MVWIGFLLNIFGSFLIFKNCHTYIIQILLLNILPKTRPTKYTTTHNNSSSRARDSDELRRTFSDILFSKICVFFINRQQILTIWTLGILYTLDPIVALYLSKKWRATFVPDGFGCAFIFRVKNQRQCFCILKYFYYTTHDNFKYK